jgi:hypothetical protein
MIWKMTKTMEVRTMVVAAFAAAVARQGRVLLLECLLCW